MNQYLNHGKINKIIIIRHFQVLLFQVSLTVSINQDCLFNVSSESLNITNKTLKTPKTGTRLKIKCVPLNERIVAGLRCQLGAVLIQHGCLNPTWLPRAVRWKAVDNDLAVMASSRSVWSDTGLLGRGPQTSLSNSSDVRDGQTHSVPPAGVCVPTACERRLHLRECCVS